MATSTLISFSHPPHADLNTGEGGAGEANSPLFYAAALRRTNLKTDITPSHYVGPLCFPIDVNYANREHLVAFIIQSVPDAQEELKFDVKHCEGLVHCFHF